MRRPALYGLMAVIFVTVGCAVDGIPDPSEVIVLQEGPDDDVAYARALRVATRSAQVFDDFETRFLVETTYLSSTFKGAFDRRLAELYGKDHYALGDGGERAAFFISVFAPNDDKANLKDRNIWTLTLKQGEHILTPSVVKRLSDKTRWEAFFGYVNKWSQEYFVIFDPSPTEQLDLDAGKVELVLAASDATVRMFW